MFCPQCGSAIAETDRFCRACGGATGIHQQGTVPTPALPAGKSPISPPDSPLPSPLKRPGLVTLLAVFHFIGGGLLLLIAIAIGVAAAGESQPLPLAIVSGLFALFAVLHLFCGFGLMKLKPWGRLLQIGLSVVGLLGFPLGTLISILILVYMFRPGIALLFSGRSPETFTPAESQAVHAQASGESAVTVAVVVVAGLLVFIALAGIVAAIAVPNFLNAVQRGRQKRTIADMRAVAAALESFGADNNYYPDAATIDELARALEPAYIRTLPRTDGWGRPLKYEAWLEGEDEDMPTTYALGSAGKDGVWERADLIDTPEGRTVNYDADLVLVNGAFVQLPEGEGPGWVERPTDVLPESPSEQEPKPPALRS